MHIPTILPFLLAPLSLVAALPYRGPHHDGPGHPGHHGHHGPGPHYGPPGSGGDPHHEHHGPPYGDPHEPHGPHHPPCTNSSWTPYPTFGPPTKRGVFWGTPTATVPAGSITIPVISTYLLPTPIWSTPVVTDTAFVVTGTGTGRHKHEHTHSTQPTPCETHTYHLGNHGHHPRTASVSSKSKPPKTSSDPATTASVLPISILPTTAFPIFLTSIPFMEELQSKKPKITSSFTLAETATSTADLWTWPTIFPRKDAAKTTSKESKTSKTLLNHFLGFLPYP